MVTMKNYNDFILNKLHLQPLLSKKGKNENKIQFRSS